MPGANSGISVASDKGYTAVVALSLDANGIVINTSCDYGRSLLFRAASRGHEEVVAMLVETAALDINSGDKQDDKPI